MTPVTVFGMFLSMLYFLSEAEHLKRTKVGYVRSDRKLAAHIKLIQGGNGTELELAAALTFCGTGSLSKIHESFKPFAQNAGWFVENEGLAKLVAWAKAHPEASVADLSAKLRSLENRQTRAVDTKALVAKVQKQLRNDEITQRWIGARIAKKANVCPVCGDEVSEGEEVLEIPDNPEWAHAGCAASTKED